MDSSPPRVQHADTRPSTGRSPNPLYYYHIPQTTLTLYIQDTGSRLPRANILSGLESLGVDIVYRIQRTGDGPARKLYIREGSVAISFTPAPRELSWIDLREVIDAMEAIVEHDDWTFACQVTVSDSRAQPQAVGSLTIVYKYLEGGKTV
ncbi:MAG: hypothetical protein Q9222_002766 [Ikaeria aurantiellina]